MLSKNLSKFVVRNVYTCEKNEKLMRVIKAMARRRISCAIVVEKKKPVGIISERDVIRLVAKGALEESVAVKDTMSSPVYTVRENVTIETAMKYMMEKGFRRFPVVNGREELVGLITQSDIVRAAEKSLRDYARELESRIEKVSRRTAKLIMTDELTGLYNRRYLKQRLAEEFERAKRYSLPISCLMIDIDRFKTINDEFGHPAGDLVLKKLARLFIRNLRRGDICARIGGEEFFVLLPHTMVSGATILANRLRREVEKAVFTYRGKRMHITVSIGICNLPAHEPASAQEFFRMADDALYAAKRNGRNRVEAYDARSTETARAGK